MASLVPDKVGDQIEYSRVLLGARTSLCCCPSGSPRVPGHRMHVDVGTTTPAAHACPLLHTHTCVFRALGPAVAVSKSGTRPEQRLFVWRRTAPRWDEVSDSALPVEEDGPEVG